MDQIATAFHEAGHALYALSIGVPVTAMTIITDGTDEGRCDYGSDGPCLTPDQSLCLSLAGPIAEELHHGRGEYRRGLAVTYYEVSEALEDAVCSGYFDTVAEAEQHIGNLWAAVSALLQDRSTHLTNLAAALLNAGMMDQRQITAAVG
jgi:hypothetical protein